MAGVDEFNNIQNAAEEAAGFAEAEAIRRQSEMDAMSTNGNDAPFYTRAQGVDAQKAAEKVQGYTGVNPTEMSKQGTSEQDISQKFVEALSNLEENGQAKQGRDFVIVGENSNVVDTNRVYTKEDIEMEALASANDGGPNTPPVGEDSKDGVNPVTPGGDGASSQSQKNSAAIENEVKSRNELVNTEKMLENQLKDGHFVNKADVEKITQKYLEDISELQSKGDSYENAAAEANKIRKASVENLAKHAQKYDEKSLRQMQVQAAMKGERFDVYRKVKGNENLVQTTVGRTNMTLKQFQRMGKAKEGMGIASRRIGGQGFAMRNSVGQVLQGDAASMSKGTLMLTVSLAIVLLNSMKKSLDQNVIKNIEKALAKNVDFVDMDTLSKMVEDAQKDKSSEKSGKETSERGDSDKDPGSLDSSSKDPELDDDGSYDDRDDSDTAHLDEEKPQEEPEQHEPTHDVDSDLENEPVDVYEESQKTPDPADEKPMEEEPQEHEMPSEHDPADETPLEEESVDDVALDDGAEKKGPDFDKEINENLENPEKSVKEGSEDDREGVDAIQMNDSASNIGDSCTRTIAEAPMKAAEAAKEGVEELTDTLSRI